MKGYRICFIRHGRTKANDEGIYIGKTDYSLSESGSEEIINKLDEFTYPRVAEVYTSPLKRCIQTAHLLFEGMDMRVTDDLSELDFGDFEGKTPDELINNDEYKAWLKGGIDNRPPNGESIAELTMRSYNALEHIIMDMMYNDITEAAVVTHAGVISNIISCFGVPKYNPKDIRINPGEGIEVLVTAQMWQQSQAFEVLGLVPYDKDDIHID